VGIGITSPLIRNISSIARAVVTLTEIGGDDRFILGLGVGGLQDLAKLGLTVEKPSVLLRDAVNLLRRVWRGETVTYKGEHFQLEHYHARYGLGYQIPIYLGVRGPKLLELAGEIADGAILSGPKNYLTKAVDQVKKGMRRSEKPERAFKLVVWVPTMVTETKQDVNLVKKIVAIVLADTPTNVLEMAELDTEKVTGIKKAFQRFGVEKAARLVTEELIRETTIHGSSQQICDAFESLEDLGVDEVVFGPPYGANRERAMRQLAEAWRRHV
jgi:5,10-methylenetetrahydromethanopterin reductase